MVDCATRVLYQRRDNDFCSIWGMATPPTDAREAAKWVRDGREKRGWSTTALADRARAIARRAGDMIALPQQSVSNFEQGEAKRIPSWLRYVRIAFEEADGTTSDDHPPKGAAHEAGPRQDRPDQPKPSTADAGETAPVIRLDLSYSMGPGTDIDSAYIDGEAFEFDVGFLRSMTISPADRIRIVDGIGDSMQPTLHDRDLLFVDINQRDLNAQDRIWAIWLYGLGAVKRLRALSAETVLVMSDNPDVPDQEVSRRDILIHGRVVGSIKRH